MAVLAKTHVRIVLGCYCTIPKAIKSHDQYAQMLVLEYIIDGFLLQPNHFKPS